MLYKANGNRADPSFPSDYKWLDQAIYKPDGTLLLPPAPN